VVSFGRKKTATGAAWWLLGAENASALHGFFDFDSQVIPLTLHVSVVDGLQHVQRVLGGSASLD
jgi:hypothetical protein